MFSRLGRFAYRRRWAVIGVWAVLLAIGAVFAPRAGSVLRSTVGDAPTEARVGLDILERDLDFPPSVIVLTYSSRDLTVDDPRFRERVETSITGLRDLPYFVRADTFWSTARSAAVSRDRHATYVLAWVSLQLDEAIDREPEMRARIAPAEGMDIGVTGPPVIYHDLENAVQRDLFRAEVITFPLLLVALVLVFGGLVAAGLPVLMGGVSLVLTLALLFFLGHVMQMSVFAQNVASLLGLGVAVDYTLFMVNRFREEIARRDTEDAVAVTLATAGRAVLFSGIATVLGLSGLLIFQFSFLRSLGVGGMVVVLLSVLVAMTLVPAILGVLGEKVNALPVLPRRPGREGRFWRNLAHGVMKRPLLFFLPAAAGLVLLGAPFLGINLGPVWAGALPQDAPARVAWERAGDTFGGGELLPIVIAVEAPGGVLRPDAIGPLYDYTRRLAAVPGVERIESIVDLAPGLPKETYQEAFSDPALASSTLGQKALAALARGRTTMVRVYTPHAVVSREAKDLVKAVRAVPIDGGLTRYVTGATASLEDSVQVLYRDFPKAVLIVVATIYVALLFQFRSLVLPLKAVIMNSASILASFGALVFIFQQGHLHGLLNFRADGTVEATVPILLFCSVFGLSMDYELFLLSRIQEEYQRTGDNTAAVAVGMERSGRIITSAAMVVVLVGIAFSAGDVIIIKTLGLGLALAVFIDATVVRALMVPSLMRLLGRYNWWAPGPLQRLLPRWEEPPSEPGGHLP